MAPPLTGKNGKVTLVLSYVRKFWASYFAPSRLCGKYSDSFGCGPAALGVMWLPFMSRSLQTMSGAVLQYDIVSGFQWRRQVGFAKHLPQIYFRGPAHL